MQRKLLFVLLCKEKDKIFFNQIKDYSIKGEPEDPVTNNCEINHRQTFVGNLCYNNFLRTYPSIEVISFGHKLGGKYIIYLKIS